MFDSKKLENKEVTVTNNGNATINGLPPGKAMPLKANVEGKPTDEVWRRLTRHSSPKSVLTLSGSNPAKAITPAKAKTTKKGE